MPAFKIQHVAPYDVPSTGGSQTITAVDEASCVLINASSMSVSGGQNGSSANNPVDEGCLGLELTSSTNINYVRATTAALATRGQLAAWEYTGAAGGANEFKVRGRGTVTIATTARTGTATCDTTPTDIDNCVVFITGITNTLTTSNDWDNCTGVGWLSGTNTVNFERGGQVGTTTFYYTVVEFTGSNWTIHHAFSGDFTADTGSIDLYDGQKGTGTLSDVAAWNKAFIVKAYKADDNSGNYALADINCVMTPNTDLGIIDYEFDVGHDATDNQLLCYVIENSDTNFSVARYNSGAHALQVTHNQTITAVTNLTEALCMVTTETSGTGTAHQRGMRNAGFNSTTEATSWIHRTGNTGQIEYQIIDFYGMDEGGTVVSLSGVESTTAVQSPANSGYAPKEFAATFNTISTGDTIDYNDAFFSTDAGGGTIISVTNTGDTPAGLSFYLPFGLPVSIAGFQGTPTVAGTYSMSIEFVTDLGVLNWTSQEFIINQNVVNQPITGNGSTASVGSTGNGVSIALTGVSSTTAVETITGGRSPKWYTDVLTQNGVMNKVGAVHIGNDIASLFYHYSATENNIVSIGDALPDGLVMNQMPYAVNWYMAYLTGTIAEGAAGVYNLEFEYTTEWGTVTRSMVPYTVLDNVVVGLTGVEATTGVEGIDAGVAPQFNTVFFQGKTENDTCFWFTSYFSAVLNTTFATWENIGDEPPEGIVAGKVSENILGYTGIPSLSSAGTYNMQARVTTKYGSYTFDPVEWIISEKLLHAISGNEATSSIDSTTPSTTVSLSGVESTTSVESTGAGIAPKITAYDFVTKREGDESFWYQAYISANVFGATSIEWVSIGDTPPLNTTEFHFVPNMVNQVGILSSDSAGTYGIQYRITTEFGSLDTPVYDWVIVDVVEVALTGNEATSNVGSVSVPVTDVEVELSGVGSTIAVESTGAGIAPQYVGSVYLPRREGDFLSGTQCYSYYQYFGATPTWEVINPVPDGAILDTTESLATGLVHFGGSTLSSTSAGTYEMNIRLTTEFGTVEIPPASVYWQVIDKVTVALSGVESTTAVNSPAGVGRPPLLWLNQWTQDGVANKVGYVQTGAEEASLFFHYSDDPVANMSVTSIGDPLPDGVTFYETTYAITRWMFYGQGEIAAGAAGDYNIILRAENEFGYSDLEFTYTVLENVIVPITGNSTTATVGQIQAGGNIIAPLSGIEANSSVGDTGFAKSGSIAVTGTEAASDVGSIGHDISLQLTGAATTVETGSLIASAGGSVGLSGISATTAVGDVVQAVSIALSGDAVTIAYGDVGSWVNASVSGVQIAASVNDISVLGLERDTPSTRILFITEDDRTENILSDGQVVSVTAENRTESIFADYRIQYITAETRTELIKGDT